MESLITVIILAIVLYSVIKPATGSDSASGKS